MRARSASGQILVLVLLVVLVGLTIGLSIASRTLSNLKDTSQLDQSNRAFSAAEAGVEKALSVLKTSSSGCASNACAISGLTGITGTTVSVANVGGNTNAFGLPSLHRDDVLQVSLSGYAGTSLGLYWGVTADRSNCATTAAVVVSVIYQTGTTYGMSKKALDACAADASHSNGFDSGSVSSSFSYTPVAGLTIQDSTVHNDYGYKATIDLSSSGMVPAGATMLAARFRLMYGDTTEQIAVAPASGQNLPAQGQQITSTAVSGGKQRTVKVLRSNASLPAIFDYALFNGSTNTLSK